MSPLPPFVAKLTASDGSEEKKYFETWDAAQEWILGEGKDRFDGDVERAEIHRASKGFVWFKDHPKIEGIGELGRGVVTQIHCLISMEFPSQNLSRTSRHFVILAKP
jgi:hypothetical protein